MVTTTEANIRQASSKGDVTKFLHEMETLEELEENKAISYDVLDCTYVIEPTYSWIDGIRCQDLLTQEDIALALQENNIDTVVVRDQINKISNREIARLLSLLVSFKGKRREQVNLDSDESKILYNAANDLIIHIRSQE